MKINEAIGGTVNTIPAGTYVANQIGNDLRTHGAIVNFSASRHVSEDAVYKVTKAIKENLAKLQETAVWMPSTVTKEKGLALIASRLHPGALCYYQEAGWKFQTQSFSKNNFSHFGLKKKLGVRYRTPLFKSLM